MDLPPDWDEAGQTCFNLVRGLVTHASGFLNLPEAKAAAAAGLEPLVRYLFAQEREIRAKNVVTAASVASSGVLPAGLSTAEGYFLYLRISAACDFVGQIFPPASAEFPLVITAEGWDVKKLRRWLLVDLWNRRSDHWLKLVALEWIGPFPLYGIEPVKFG